MARAAICVIEPALAQTAVHHVTLEDLRVMEAFLDEAERAIPDDVPEADALEQAEEVPDVEEPR